MGTLMKIDDPEPEPVKAAPKRKPRVKLTREGLISAAALIGAAILVAVTVQMAFDREGPLPSPSRRAAAPAPTLAPASPAEVQVRSGRGVGAVLDNPAAALHRDSATPRGFAPSMNDGDNARYGGLRSR